VFLYYKNLSAVAHVKFLEFLNAGFSRVLGFGFRESQKMPVFASRAKTFLIGLVASKKVLSFEDLSSRGALCKIFVLTAKRYLNLA
jgi:hypothetical protein